MISVLEYHRPDNPNRATEIIANGEYTIVAGGTDLMIQMRDGKPRKLCDLTNACLDYVHDLFAIVEIGSATSHSSVARNPVVREKFPALACASGMIGNLQIRNRGTIGGNIVNASPCADTIPALLLYNANVILSSVRENRHVPLEQFIVNPYKTVIRPDEIMRAVYCTVHKVDAGWSYIKLGRRQAVNISRMTVAVSLVIKDKRIESVRIAAGSVFPSPARMTLLEGMLEGQRPSRKLFTEAANFGADMMVQITGRRWSTSYKEPVLISLLTRALEEATVRSGTEIIP